MDIYDGLQTIELISVCWDHDITLCKLHVTCVVQQGTPDSCMTYKVVAADNFMIHTITKFRRLATSSKYNRSLPYYFVIL